MYKVGDRVKVLGMVEEYDKKYNSYGFPGDLESHINDQGVICKVTSTSGVDEPSEIYSVNFYSGSVLDHEHEFYEKELKLMPNDWDD
jgi:hypothetical protein